MRHSFNKQIVLSIGVLLISLFSASAIALPFNAQGSGPFSVSAVAPTIVLEDQIVTFDFVSPFPLTSGHYQGLVDLTIPSFPDRLISASFTLSNAGEDALFGTYTVETSIFTNPVNPLAGDVIGSEDFTGSFTFTGGAGKYAGATGGGIYSGHSEYMAFDPAANPYVLLAGQSTITATGTVAVVPEPSTLGLITLGLVMLFCLRRHKYLEASVAGAV